MIPVGYMYKSISEKPEWLKASQVSDIYSVSGCVSEDFDDWINYWKHNGYWFFDSPKIIEDLAKENNIDLKEKKLFFYKVYELQWNDEIDQWEGFDPEDSFETNILTPQSVLLHGYDVTTFTAQNYAECSPLSCNHMAEELKVNCHCLLGSFGEAKELIESGAFNKCEPGPYRIFEVYTVENA